MESTPPTATPAQPAPEAPKVLVLSTENAARSHLLSRQMQKPVDFRVVEFDGAKLCVVRPTVGQRASIIKQGLVMEPSGFRADAMRKRVAALIACARTLGDDGKPGCTIFGEADFSAIYEMQSEPGDLVDVVGGAALDFMETKREDGSRPTADEKRADAKNG